MLTQVYYNKEKNFTWIDVISPNLEDLDELATSYKLPKELLHDSIEADHLPKFENIADIDFLILRGYDDCASQDDELKVSTLTRKLALFFTKDFLITIHRSEQIHLERVKNLYNRTTENFQAHKLIAKIIKETVLTYDKPIEASLIQFDAIEYAVHKRENEPFIMERIFAVKKENSVYRRMLRMSIEVIHKLQSSNTLPRLLVQDLKEETEDLVFYTEDLSENINNLLNLHMSLISQETNESSFKTNEVMRVLTVLSLFFLPLNLIVGIYGMNFENMPELKTQYGYFFTLGIMASVALGIYLWFRKKGWMKND
ncbi:MAG: CorA family divalent cation transporter [Bacteriovoracaceae bacterium]